MAQRTRGPRGISRWLRQARHRTAARLKRHRSRQSLLEPLEARLLLTVASPPIEPLATVGHPLEVQLAPLDGNASHDLIALGSAGDLTLALNGGDNTWSSAATVDLGTGPLVGMVTGRLDSDLPADLVLQGADAIYTATSDGAGGLTLSQTIPASLPGSFAPASGQRVGLTVSLLDHDLIPDVATVSPGTDEVVVILGQADGTLGAPAYYASGGVEPIVVVSGNFVGDRSPDLAVGHSDGSLALLEGAGDGSFVLRSELTITAPGAINDLAAGDLDEDNDLDIVVTRSTAVEILLRDADPMSDPALQNGNFTLGLSGWTTEIVGHAPDATPGSINAQSGFAQLAEHDSFLISLQQSFVVPDNPQSISADLVSLNLDEPNGGIPDAFEISLLDSTLQSLVSTHASDATAFFNANPGGQFSLASGVTFDGTTVTVDISGLAPGTEATLYFDLIGNAGDLGSVAGIDNVIISPDTMRSETFSSMSLPGPFADARSVSQGDVDGDGSVDVVVVDAALNQLVVFNGDGAGGFTREALDLSSFGSTPSAVAIGPLTAGDSVVDVAVTIRDADRVLTPLNAQSDDVAPTVHLVSPAQGEVVTTEIGQLLLRYSEAVRDDGAAGTHSVTNPAAYRLFHFGANGVFEDGGGDDQLIAISSVAYDSATFEATLTVDSAGLPLIDAQYRLVIEGDDTDLAIEDLAGNRLGDGSDVAMTFTVNTPPSVDAPAAISADEGQSVSLFTTFSDPGLLDPHTATINWGDGTVTSAGVCEMDGVGTINGGHTYADNGLYHVTVTVADSRGQTASAGTTAQIANVDPTVTPAADNTADEGALVVLEVATFTDPGFTSAAGGTVETFTATIDWGDNTVIDDGVVTVVQGGPGVLTLGAVSGSHTYANEGQYTVTVTAGDDDLGEHSASLTVDVNNLAPVVQSVTPVESDEGSEVTVVGTFSDAGRLDTHTATVFWSDGSESTGVVVEADGQGTVTADHTYADNGLYVVRIEVTDDAGATGGGEASAEIANVAPSVTGAGPQQAVEGIPLAIDVATFNDPGFTSAAAGTSESFTATIDWGDGEVTTGVIIDLVQGSVGVPTTGTVAGEHAYADEGEYPVTVYVTDDDDGVGSGTFTVTVENAAPVVTAPAEVTANEGQFVDFTAFFTDSGVLDTHTAVIYWGDGSSSEAVVNETDGSGTLSASHTYADNGSYTVAVEVTDSDGAVGTGETMAHIANVAPDLTATDRRVYAGVEVSIHLGTFTDPGFTSIAAGTEETFDAIIDWGDGAPPEAGIVLVQQGDEGVLTTGSVLATHTYSALGDYAVTVTLTDDDGGSDTATMTVTAVTKLFVVDDSAHETFRYSPDGGLLSQSELTGPNSAPRGAATDPSGQTLWVIDHSKDVHVYDALSGTPLGIWKAADISNPQGIATDGTDIWIVNAAKDAIYHYADAASFLSGDHNSSDRIDLDSNNRNPSGLTTDGEHFWVTDEKSGSQRVFVYSFDGVMEGVWDLDPANGDPSGIAIDPAGNLWTSDRLDGAAYFYAGAATRRDGTQLATSFFVLDAANQNPEGIADPVVTIELGDVVTGTIAATTQVDDYVFDVTAGQRLFIDIQAGNAYLDWVLTDPLGSVVASDGFFRDRGPLQMALTGQYTFTVTAERVANYQFQIVEVPDTVTTPIEIGDVVSGAIAVQGEVDLYTFDATAGQRLFVDAQRGSAYLSWALKDPGGTVISSDGFFRDVGPVTLSDSGQYTFVVDGDDGRTELYRFQIVDVPATVTTPIGIGDIVSGAISVQGEVDLYTFDAAAGQVLFVDTQQGTAYLSWALRDPSGTLISSDGFFRDKGSIALPATGQYTFVVDGDADRIEAYRFQIWDSTPFTQAISLDTIVPGFMAPGQQITYTFDALAGDELLFDVQQAGSNKFTLQDPGGTAIFANVTSDQLLASFTTGGTYSVIVAPANPSDPDANGPFQFRVQHQIDPPAVGTLDSQGTEFWMAFPSATTTQLYTLFVSAEQDTQVVVDVPSQGFYHAADVPAGGLTEIRLPNAVVMSRFANDIVENKGVHLVASGEVTIQVLFDGEASSDAYLALPVDALGTEYLVATQTAGCPLGCGNSEFTVLATQDNTTVTITPTVNAGGSGVHPAGVPYDVILDQGQTYRVTGGSYVGFTDLTGTSVVADRPVFVLGANQATMVPVSVGQADFLVEQIPPLSSWGRRFITLPFASRVGGDTFKIVAARDNTVVKINGLPVATLNRGQAHQQIIDGPAEITSDQPLLVVQFAHGQNFDDPSILGDPMMLQVPPAEQFRDTYSVAVPDTRFAPNFVNIIALETAIGSITLDGVPIDAAEFTSIGSTQYVGASLSVSPGTYRLEGDAAFGVVVYGFSNYSSYGYTGGTALSRSAEVDQLLLTPEVASLLTGDTHLVTATVLDASGSPIEGIRVDFNVTGAHSTAGSGYSDPSGLVQFSYVGLQTGSDTISASVGTIIDTATVEWIAPAPTIFVTSPTNGDEVTEGSTLLVSGRALPSATQGRIVAVSVDGRSVDAVDAAGNFFAEVLVQPGANSYEFTAIDQFGYEATVTLELQGVSDSSGTIDEANLADVTTAALLSYTHTTFNRQTATLHTDVQLTNQSLAALAAPLLAAYGPIRPLSVTLANPDGILADGRAFVRFDSELPGARLDPAAVSDPIRLGFANGKLSRFDFDVSLLAAANSAPRFTSSPATTAIVSAEYTYQAAAQDAEQPTLAYRLDEAPAGMTIDPDTGVIQWVPAAGQVGNHQVQLVVDDAFGGRALQSFQIEVRTSIPNRPPQWTSVPPTQIDSGQDYQYLPSAWDPDGQALSFSLDTAPAGTTVDPTTGEVNLAGPADGTFTLALRVEDGVGGAAVQEFVVTVGQVPLNAHLPQFDSLPVTEATVDALYVYFAHADDLDGDPITYQLVSAPAGMSIDPSTGRVDFTPTLAQLGPQAVLISASDSAGGVATQSFAVQVADVAPNAAPIISSTPVLLATVDELYSYDMAASDPEGDLALTYQLVSGPAGMSIDANTGQLTWTPTSAQLGTHVVQLSASDSAGGGGYQQFTLEVRGTNVAPVLQSNPPTEIAAGASYRYDVLATDLEDAITYSLVTGPEGMKIGQLNGILFWKTDTGDLGDHSVVIRATDERGLFAEQAYTLTVTPDVDPPLVTIQLDTNLIAVGQSVRIEVLASDNVAVDHLGLTIDGVAQTLDANNGVLFTSTAAGLPDIVATATDTSGNVGYASAELRVLDPADTEAPVVELTSPAPGSLVTYLTDLWGTVTDDNLEFYRVQVSPAGTEQWTTIAEFDANVTNDILGTFDPTLLARDIYDLRILAQDVNGLQTSEQIELSVEGGAQLGNFRLEFADLTIPLTGIPIQVGRIYDTLDASRSGDFGFGWTLGLRTARIRETVRLSQAEAAGAPALFGGNPFRTGTRVYLNAPDGGRVGFTFDPVPEPGLLGTVWKPRFTADPGVFERLEVDEVALSQNEDGTFGLYLLGGFAYNPREYTLVTKDQLRYRYDQFDELRDVTDRNGNVLTYTDDGIFSSTGESIQFVRDALGRITEVIDPAGNSIVYTYDAAGNLKSVTDQVGNVTQYTYLSDPGHYLDQVIDPRGNLSSRTEYDDDGRVVAVYDAFGNAVTQSYDLANNTEVIANRLGNETTLVFDDRGNILTETDPLGNTITRVYDADDNEVEVTDARGFTTLFTYDDQRNVTSVTDPLGGVTTRTYNEFNDITSLTDALGRVTTATYDAFGNLAEIIDAAGGSTSQSVDSMGRVTSRTDANGATTTFVYTGTIEQPTQVINPDGTSRSFSYNQYGQTTSVTDELGHTRLIVYDELGRLITERGPNGQITTNTYDDDLLVTQTVTISASDSRVTQLVYDARNRVAQVINANGGVTSFTYDANDDILSLTDPMGNTTFYAYDAAQRLVRQTDPLGASTTFAYDKAGNETEIVDRNDRRRTFEYDALGRLIFERWFGEAGEIREIGFTYDAVSNLLVESDPDSKYAYTYDTLNRRTSSDNTGTPGALTLILNYSYDGIGNVRSVTDHFGVAIESTYDDLGRLTSRQWSGGGIDDARIDFAYNDRGDRTATDRYADLAGSERVGSSGYGYDESGRVASIDHLDALDAAIAEYDYAYDLANQLTQETHHGETVDYEYDPLGQLTAADRTVQPDEFYAYGANGNRTSSHLHGSEYVTGPNNQLLSDGEFDYAYDAEGNLVLKTAIGTGDFTEYEYDHRNRLIRVAEHSSGGIILSESEYTYDTQGRRIATTVNTDGDGLAPAERTYYIYDGLNTWADFDASGAVVARYLYGTQIDEILARWQPSEGTAWYLTDRLGSVRDLVDATGLLVNHIDYDSFGQVLSQSNAVVAGRFRFTAREFEAATGQYLFRNRSYDAAIGRFTQQDPIGFDSQDTNLYRYTENSPTNATDPRGLAALPEFVERLTARHRFLAAKGFALSEKAALFSNLSRLALQRGFQSASRKLAAQAGTLSKDAALLTKAAQELLELIRQLGGG